MSMEEARTTSPHAGMSAKVAPPNPTERLAGALDKLGATVDNLQGTAHRIHDRTYGEYQPGPRAEDDAVEFGGRIGEFHERVRSIQNQAEQALEILESLETNS